MIDSLGPLIAEDIRLSLKQCLNTLSLLEAGATVPFISRYRKEQTGSLDEVAIQNIADKFKKYTELQKRKETILATIEEQDKLTEELKDKISNCWESNALEDLYLPFKPKRKTKASIAKAKGLEPLAGSIMKQGLNDVESYAYRFIKGDVETVEDALSGARDIIAEWVNERAYARNVLRRLYQRTALIESKLIKGKNEEGVKYENYFDFSEPLSRCPSHRLLAMRRGDDEGVLKVSIKVDEAQALDQLERIFVKSHNECGTQVKLAVKDAFKRLLSSSLETEFKKSSKEKADEEAIRVFAENLRQLLLTPPLGPKRVLAIDPGFRTGCKVVCLDEHGALLHNENIYPHPPQSETSKAASKISNLIEAYKLEAIAIGNGTAGRETERFIQKNIRFKSDVAVYVVNEAGASIYSASKIAREEFPKYDVTVRGSVSIGRRLMDPLAELVKIEPKSIGVGQYQHDVDQGSLKNSLDKIVESSVNQVGVNLNTASKHLLTYVSGLGPKLASNVIEHRDKNGAFKNRSELKTIAGLGPKAYEQAAGFLRISQGENPLDNSAVHPESYAIVKRMAKDLNENVESLIGNKAVLETIVLDNYISDKVGLPTLKDIISELSKAGRDPRGKAKMFSFDPNIRKMDDLKIGMILNGLVSNITKFGAFVDIGVKQDGLIHVSEMADRYISDPNEIVKLQQQVRVKVIDIDVARKRIQLSLKQANS